MKVVWASMVIGLRGYRPFGPGDWVGCLGLIALGLGQVGLV